ncbi:MAG: CoA transferase [Thermoprotei archaeon]|nr:MAG: CoA transferase [Thermoprotei archaeon]
MADAKGPLHGIRVLDLTKVLAGPFCTMILADLGAEVIKIERPGVGDDSRFFTPFIKGQSAYFININRGKKSIVINLKNPKGKELFLKLVEKADVVVENFKPGTMEKLGLSYDMLKKVNPRIIYASISGFGQYGPYRDRLAYDLIAQAMGGIMSITGWPETPPTRVGTAIADILAGLYCCIAILAALRAREVTGEGQRIDVAMVDSVMAACEAYNEMWLVEKKIPTRIGNRYEFVYPYDSFKAKDGWVVIGVGNDDMWKRFCNAIGKPELINHENFNTNEKRVKNHREVRKVVEEWTTKRNVSEIVRTLLKHKIPCAPIYSMRDVCEDEHIAKIREMVVEITQPGVGKVKIVGSPIKITPSTCKVRGPAPLLGQHTKEVLKEILGLHDEEIEKLKQEGIIHY